MKCKKCSDRGSIFSVDGPWTEICDCQSEKKYTVVCYMRVDADDIELMDLDEANIEAVHSELMQPENIYRVEEVGEENVVP